MSRRAYTLIEILVVIAIIAVIAAILLPVMSRARQSAVRTEGVSNLRQIGTAFAMYLIDYDDRMPDRRDLKSSLGDGYRPWTEWPPSDPRTGWAAYLLRQYGAQDMFLCPGSRARFSDVPQARQVWSDDGRVAEFWMWRFDRIEDPIPLDNFWGKTPFQALEDIRRENSPWIPRADGLSDLELAVNVYFPAGNPQVPQSLQGRSAYPGGRATLYMDNSARWVPDRRLR